MKLLNYELQGVATIGALKGDGVVDLSPVVGERILVDVIAQWDDLEPKIKKLMDEPNSVIALNTIKILPPIHRTAKIIGVGANYKADTDGLNLPTDSILFFKPFSSVSGPFDTVVIPFEADRVIGETELTVIINKKGRRIPESEAMDYVFGYCIANDVTAPEIMMGESVRNPLFFQQGRGKGFPTFCPMGPYIVTADEIPDPSSLDVEMEINGKNILSGKTDRMIHSISKLIADASNAFGIEVGDALLTGSPRPTTPEGRTPLKAGDILISRISQLGEMRNDVVAEDSPYQDSETKPVTTSNY